MKQNGFCEAVAKQNIQLKIKRSLFLLLIGFSSTTFACPDFSGHYQRLSSSGITYYLTVVQNACSDLKATYEIDTWQNERPMIFDRQMRQLYTDSNTKIEEAFWWDQNLIRIITRQTWSDGYQLNTTAILRQDSHKALQEITNGIIDGKPFERIEIYEKIKLQSFQ